MRNLFFSTLLAFGFAGSIQSQDPQTMAMKAPDVLLASPSERFDCPINRSWSLVIEHFTDSNNIRLAKRDDRSREERDLAYLNSALALKKGETTVFLKDEGKTGYALIRLFGPDEDGGYRAGLDIHLNNIPEELADSLPPADADLFQTWCRRRM